MRSYLLFDIGATHTRLAVTNGYKGFNEPRVFATDPRVHGMERFLAEAEKLLDGRKVDMAVGGVASPLDYITGEIINSPNLPLWNGQNVAKEIQSELKVPVRLENDVAMGGLGEATYGVGRGKPIVAYLTISTGINGVRVVDGQIDRSSQGFQIGFQVLGVKAGGTVSLEGLAGGHSLASRYGKPPHAIAQTTSWYPVERAIVAGIYNTILYWSPDIIVLGGGMTRDLSLQRLQRMLAELPPVFAKLPELEFATLGDLGGLHGALAWARQGTPDSHSH